MNNLQNTLVEWMSFSINWDSNDTAPPIPSNWQEFLNIIWSQGLGTILFPVLDKLPENGKPEPKLFDLWRKQVIFSVTQQLYREQQLGIILESFRAAQVPLIIFKGPAIARFYNNPEYRFMSDLDILVQEKDIIRAQKEIGVMGYSLEVDEEDHPVHFGYHKNGGIYIELHRSLLNPGFLGLRQVEDWYRHIWENSRSISLNGLKFNVMAVEDELINQILHFATHFVYSTVFMKHFYDIALIIKCNVEKINWAYVEESLKTLKLLKLGNLIFSICKKYFHVCIPEKLSTIGQIYPEQFLEMFLNDFAVENKPGDKKGWRVISYQYPLLCKYTVLLPFVWAIELYFQLKTQKGKIMDSFRNAWENISSFQSRAQVLKALDLSG